MRDKKNIYPELATLLKGELMRFQELNPNLNRGGIAIAWKISPSDLSEVVNGSKHPSPAFITNFVNGRYPKKPEAREALRVLINEAVKKAQPYLDTLRKRLKAGEKLKVTTIDYPPFAGDSECFFEAVFSRFLDLAGIHFDQPECRIGNRLQDYKDSDFSLGMFDGADRMLTLDRKFWRVPVRMGLGAVCLRKHKEHQIAITHLLSDVDAIEDLQLMLIVVNNDIGWRHCVNRLRVLDRQIEVKELDSLDVSQLAAQLTEAGEHETKIPVVCTDEFTCLQILRELKHIAYSVFPMNSRRTGQDEKESTRRELPQFYCSVGVDGNDRDFQEFMQDALEQFLSTEIETTAHSWAKLAEILAEKLAQISREQLPAYDRSGYLNAKNEKFRKALSIANAWEWVFYTLNLDLKSIDTYPNFNNLPWKPILLRARSLVQSHLADQNELLRNLVELLWDSNQGKNRLCNVLDVDLSREFRNLPKPYIVSALKRELDGSRALPISVKDYDPNPESDSALAMRRFMRSLQNVYDGLGRAEAVKRLREEVDGMMNGESLYGGQSGLVILARLAEQSSFIGGACLLHHGDRDMCEIRYLWVEHQYRGNGVGQQIIQEALKLADKRFRSTGVYVEVLGAILVTAEALFKEVGFLESKIPPATEGRNVLEFRYDMRQTEEK